MKNMFNEQQLLDELYIAQNNIIEEQNFIEILKVYCENTLEKSAELNKIYTFISMIDKSHKNILAKINDIISII